MSSSAAEELAKKKARLAELRKAKEARSSEATKRAAGAPSMDDLLSAAGMPFVQFLSFGVWQGGCFGSLHACPIGIFETSLSMSPVFVCMHQAFHASEAD